MAAPIAARGSPHNARRDRRSDAAAGTTSRRASCAPSPTARAARMTRPVRGSVCNCFAISCFLHYRSDAARRFVDRSLSCAAGAAAQAPLGLNAGCETAFMSRVLGRQGSRIGTPFGASFSHRTRSAKEGRLGPASPKGLAANLESVTSSACVTAWPNKNNGFPECLPEGLARGVAIVLTSCLEKPASLK